MKKDHSIEVLLTITMPEALIESLQQVSPRLHVTVMPCRSADEVPADVWSRVEVLYTDVVLPDPVRVPKLRLLQFHWAGIDFALNEPLLKKPDLTVATLSGASAPQMGEFVIMMLLSLGHRMSEIFANQTRTDWPRDRWERFSPRELRGSTVGIIGYGSVGREVARLLGPFGCTILAVKRDVKHPQDTGYCLPGLGDPNGDCFHRMYPIQAMKSMIKECDYVVVALPLTPATANLIGADEFKVMKNSAGLVVVGRGGVVNQAALLTAMQERNMAYAAVDVFEDEPLAPSSPFWRLPNVIVTPHIAGISPLYKERAMALFAENLQRYVEEMPILNQFDPLRGY